MGSYFQDLIGLLFPPTCIICGNVLLRVEQEICLRCRYQLPVTNYHLCSRNPVVELFYGKVPVCHASAFLHFNKGSELQKSIHRFKYYRKEQVGAVMGGLFGTALCTSPFYQDVDCIVPVPLTRKKQQQRGYNQSEVFGRAMAEAMGVELALQCLLKRRDEGSQTRRSRYQRWVHAHDCYCLAETHGLCGKHVLLVDDVVTTGATLEACCQQLLQAPGIKISVGTLACAT